MGGAERQPDESLVKQTVKKVEKGYRCVNCFVHVLEDEGVPVPNQVAELAPALEGDLGRSGYVCGVLVAALLSRSLEKNVPFSDAPLTRPEVVPIHDWLEALSVYPEQDLDAQRCSHLANQLTDFALEHYGGTDCRSISGADWPMEKSGIAGVQISIGYVENCLDFIAQAARMYRNSLTQDS